MNILKIAKPLKIKLYKTFYVHRIHTIVSTQCMYIFFTFVYISTTFEHNIVKKILFCNIFFEIVILRDISWSIVYVPSGTRQWKHWKSPDVDFSNSIGPTSESDNTRITDVKLSRLPPVNRRKTQFYYTS